MKRYNSLHEDVFKRILLPCWMVAWKTFCWSVQKHVCCAFNAWMYAFYIVLEVFHQQRFAIKENMFLGIFLNWSALLCGCRFLTTPVLKLMMFYTHLRVKRFGKELFSFRSSGFRILNITSKSKFRGENMHIIPMSEYSRDAADSEHRRPRVDHIPFGLCRSRNVKCSEPQPDGRWEKYVLASLSALLPAVILCSYRNCTEH